jgi:hypothetical protein
MKNLCIEFDECKDVQRTQLTMAVSSRLARSIDHIAALKACEGRCIQ